MKFFAVTFSRGNGSFYDEEVAVFRADSLEELSKLLVEYVKEYHLESPQWRTYIEELDFDNKFQHATVSSRYS